MPSPVQLYIAGTSDTFCLCYYFLCVLYTLAYVWGNNPVISCLHIDFFMECRSHIHQPIHCTQNVGTFVEQISDFSCVPTPLPWYFCLGNVWRRCEEFFSWWLLNMYKWFSVCSAGHYGSEYSCLICPGNTIKSVVGDAADCNGETPCDGINNIPNSAHTACVPANSHGKIQKMLHSWLAWCHFLRAQRVQNLLLSQGGSKVPVFWGMRGIYLIVLLYRTSLQPTVQLSSVASSKGKLWLAEMSGQSYNLSLFILRGEQFEMMSCIFCCFNKTPK